MALTPVTNGQRSDAAQLNQIIALLQAGAAGQLFRAPGSSGDGAWVTVLGKGTHADRPAAAAGNAHTYYLEDDTDGGTLFVSTGSAWVQAAKGVSAGGGGGGLVALDGGGITVPGGGLASVTFSAIPADHGNLLLEWSAQSNWSDSLDDAVCRVNGDTSVDGDLNTAYIDAGVDYDITGGGVNARGSVGSDTFVLLGTVAGGDQPPGNYGAGQASLPLYDTTDRVKAFLTQSSRPDWSSAGAFHVAIAGFIGIGYWLNMAAITSLTILPYNGSLWLAGSRFRLWGTI